MLWVYSRHRPEWILKDQLDRKDKAFVDIKSWTHFCKQVQVGRREGRGKRWGLAHGEDSGSVEVHGNIDFRKAGVTGEKLDMYNRALQRYNKKKSKSKTKDKGKKVRSSHY
jgi:hypothetical protein